ncbi:hypothetical protein G6L26_015025 [Agrobacterium radiobacter]|uniref:hypothetical protein n=1 Tax=Agrobacterium tumefaciens complex TaxID=1183400 RepID=UPI000760E0A6|nr:hypothetical protein [Agrobacterium tumefaciens]KWT86873.1 hypothetical protein ASB65_23260 [Agrobacterium tumefaciens str. B6]MQB26434.1 hypothetical protein [Agrobacterium tumefaciens]NTA06437.1 hypothetical protein [Agrobacterium tumefaciens]NTA92878.1 hypothetical protein [Agrobacterium tumefaciens]NTB14084.1 hypothetical protein [Agrobacterium tumefaciens]
MADDSAKSRLKDLIKKLVAVPDTEEELGKITDEINDLSPDSAWSNYIFYSTAFENTDGNIDADRVV